nr:immunoglobulin heavy chain junction region [Macaca mulatta]MOV89011.1 immunoglobulin heavy chain junction region [Macaca mulatta]
CARDLGDSRVFIQYLDVW